MDMDEAIRLATPKVAPVEPDSLEAQLMKLHEGNPQRQSTARIALAALKAALGELAHHGIHLSVGHADAAPPLQFPQMLHKPDGSTLIVENSDARSAAFAQGWNERPGQAGVQAQSGGGGAAGEGSQTDAPAVGEAGSGPEVRRLG